MVGQPGLQPRQVGRLVGRVHHQEEAVLQAGDHQVVEDAGGLVGELGVAHPPRRQAPDVARHQGFQRLRRAVTRDSRLAHVRNVEQTGRRARVAVLREDAVGVLHRHPVAGKGHHLRTQFTVQGVQRRRAQGALVIAHGVLRQQDRARLHARSCPLCRRT